MARSLYTEIIISATGCKPEDVAEIEDVMRHTIFHSTLDWQTREQLVTAARQAVEVLKLSEDYEFLEGNREPQ